MAAAVVGNCGTVVVAPRPQAHDRSPFGDQYGSDHQPRPAAAASRRVMATVPVAGHTCAPASRTKTASIESSLLVGSACHNSTKLKGCGTLRPARSAAGPPTSTGPSLLPSGGSIPPRPAQTGPGRHCPSWPRPGPSSDSEPPLWHHDSRPSPNHWQQWQGIYQGTWNLSIGSP